MTEAIDDTLVRRLVATQFPQWADFPIRPVAPGGWDNKTFHLGEHMVVRLPSAADYSEQVEKEYRWLPRLAPLLPLAISRAACDRRTGGWLSLEVVHIPLARGRHQPRARPRGSIRRCGSTAT